MFSYYGVKRVSKGSTKDRSCNSNSVAKSESTTTTINDERFIVSAQQLLNQFHNPTVDVDLTEYTQFASDLADQIQSSLESEEGNEVNYDEFKVGFIGLVKCRTFGSLLEKNM